MLLLCTVFAGAQEAVVRSAAGEKSVQVRKIQAQVKVDGKLEEAVWSTIEPIRDFVQTQPDLGSPASEPTEALIFYDERNIYFGFRCYDSEPQKVLARFGPHDGRTNSDSVNILIDTFHDRRTGYFFSINSRGIQYDAMTNESKGSGWEINDESWDGIWQSAASLEEWGWSAEVVIPFKSIRLAHDASQQWGLNLGRDIVRKNESAYWVLVSRYDETMKPSKAGTLSGLENVGVGRNLELIPFVSTRYRRANWRPDLNGSTATAGLDARYGLSSNLTLNLAVNPDFADTEADEFTWLLSRYEIFYPEKRKFFTEGASYFSTPMDLFFSRRVGAVLPSGEPQRILQGGKLTGKAGPWTIGAMEALTQETRYLDPADGMFKVSPQALFGTVRVRRDILQKSAIGFITVNRFQERGDFGQRESTHGVDLSILRGEHIKWVSQAMLNTSEAYPGITPQHLGWESEFGYNSETWQYGAYGKFLGREVDPSHTGFEPEVDRWSGALWVVYKPFINRWGIRQVFSEWNYDESNDTSGALQDAGADYLLRVQLKNFWNVRLEHSYDRVRFNVFTPEFRALAPTRVYTTPIWRVGVETSEAGAVSFGFKYISSKLVQYDENFYGHAKEFDITATARIGGHLRWELNGSWIREYLSNGAFYQNRRFLISRMNYQFTPKLRARALAQFAGDRHANDISINSLVAYDFTARSALFVGYNRQRHLPLARSDMGHEVFVKLSYLFSF